MARERMHILTTIESYDEEKKLLFRFFLWIIPRDEFCVVPQKVREMMKKMWRSRRSWKKNWILINSELNISRARILGIASN